MTIPPHIAVGWDPSGWHEKFVEAFRAQQAKGLAFDFERVNLDVNDWIEAVAPFDLVLWNPYIMGPISVSHFKEKVYFMETFMGKIVVPNFKTIWHFESKVAQTWLFRQAKVKTPKTFVSFDLKDAQEALKETDMPLVFKASHGASSQNVKLINNRSGAKKIVDKLFYQQNWNVIRAASSGKRSAFVKALSKGWLMEKVLGSLYGRERQAVVYWQEFIKGNPADLRISVIGDRTAFGFWRKNRPGDFRASGSGRIDYEKPIPESCLRYCVGLNRQLDFDSMAYDILFSGDGFIITEMSHSYLDKPIHNAKGFYTVTAAAPVAFTERPTWPQEVWAQWTLRRAGLVPALLGETAG